METEHTHVPMDTSQPEPTPEPQPASEVTATVDLSEYIPKGQYSHVIREKAELEQRLNALKQDREQLKSKLPDEEAFEEYQNWKLKRQQDAEKRKKEAGKFDEVLEEHKKSHAQRIAQIKQEYESRLNQATETISQLKQRHERAVLEETVRKELQPLVSTDVVDIAVREVITGANADFRVVLDENDRPVVVEKKTGSPAYNPEAPTEMLSIRAFAKKFVDSRPSFKRAEVARGSDDGRPKTSKPNLDQRFTHHAEAPATIPAPMPSQYAEAPDGTIPMAAPQSALGLQYLREALDDAAQGKDVGFARIGDFGGRSPFNR